MANLTIAYSKSSSVVGKSLRGGVARPTRKCNYNETLFLTWLFSTFAYFNSVASCIGTITLSNSPPVESRTKRVQKMGRKIIWEQDNPIMESTRLPTFQTIRMAKIFSRDSFSPSYMGQCSPLVRPWRRVLPINVCTYSSIHHKTCLSGGVHGYPDPNYFANCNRELDRANVPGADELDVEGKKWPL